MTMVDVVGISKVSNRAKQEQGKMAVTTSIDEVSPGAAPPGPDQAGSASAAWLLYVSRASSVRPACGTSGDFVVV